MPDEAVAEDADDWAERAAVLFSDSDAGAYSYTPVQLGDICIDVLLSNTQVWGSALHLSHWLVANAGVVAGRSVVELGAGAGLPSLVSARLGAASVVCTEVCDKALALLDEVAAHNELDGRLRSGKLDWFDILNEVDGSWSVLPVELTIAADCNYFSSAVPALLATFRLVIAPGGMLLLASREERIGLTECYDALLAEVDFELLESITFGSEMGSWSSADDLSSARPAAHRGDAADAAAREASSSAAHRLWVFRRRLV